ncbi:hypothetical protein [Sutcliffiella horikoshii]|uniref:hypothetical protein n=1 Tax=Sutcliffiella horikoshii TaxID=79883 RepID=UPI003CF556D5
MIDVFLLAIAHGTLVGSIYYWTVAKPIIKKKEEVEAERDKYKQLLEFRDGKLPNVLFGDSRNYFSEKEHDRLKVNTLYEEMEEIKDYQDRLNTLNESLTVDIESKDKLIKELIKKNMSLANNRDISIIESRHQSNIREETLYCNDKIIEKRVLYERLDD